MRMTSEQFADLRDLGCEIGQGYLFARPLAPDRIGPFLMGWHGVSQAAAVRSGLRRHSA
jgi:sensor c-di-GMP phosphodiesterase-like protein